MFLVGSGNVGAGLLEQIKQQTAMLKEQHITMRVCGIANSRKMLLNSDGVDLANWQALHKHFVIETLWPRTKIICFQIR